MADESRLQFTIKWSLLVTLFVSGVFGLWTATSWVGVPGIAVSIVLPTLCAIACVRAKGHGRAFWLGVCIVATISGAGFGYLSLLEHWGGDLSVFLSGIDEPKPEGRFRRSFAQVAHSKPNPSLMSPPHFLPFILLLSATAPSVGLLFAVLHWVLTSSRIRGKSADHRRT